MLQEPHDEYFIDPGGENIYCRVSQHSIPVKECFLESHIDAKRGGKRRQWGGRKLAENRREISQSMLYEVLGEAKCNQHQRQTRSEKGCVKILRHRRQGLASGITMTDAGALSTVASLEHA